MGADAFLLMGGRGGFDGVTAEYAEGMGMGSEDFREVSMAVIERGSDDDVPGIGALGIRGTGVRPPGVPLGFVPDRR